MQNEKIILSIALVLGLGLATLQAQTMYVRPYNGEQTAYAISDLQKVTFSGGQMHVQQKSSSTTNYTLSELRYVNFADLITGIEPAEKISEKLLLYPNPVITGLNISLPQFTNEDITLEIYSLEGIKLYSRNINLFDGVYSLNVEFLNKGIFICKFQTSNMALTAKFIKN